MLVLGFKEKKPSGTCFRTQERESRSNCILVSSSTSGSLDHCSFASDDLDHEALVSQVSMHLAGSDFHECSSGPDLDLNRSTVRKSSRNVRKGGKKVKDREEVEVEVEREREEDNQTLDLSKNSFSQALRECQNQRLRSEACTKKHERRRPVSLDLYNRGGDVTGSSPGLGIMKRSPVSSHRSGAFPSPGAPNYRESVGIQKGWSSERVPLPVNGSRRYVSAALLPFNNGRTFPSKWEDAERWVLSPVSGDDFSRPSLPPSQRRQKSKSGPLGPPGHVYDSPYSPSLPMFEGRSVENFMAASPLSTGIMVTDDLFGHSGSGGGGCRSYPTSMESCIMRSASVHGCSDLLTQLSLPSPQDEKLDGTKDMATMISCAVSRRDIATQMSPHGSTHSSPKGRPTMPSSAPSLLPITELQSRHSSKPEVRDVQVDGRVTITRWSKKHEAQLLEKDSESVENCKKKWEVAETAKCISKFKREEAKITAWENFQKAKAEAAVRKLEMKLEKKRSSSMDKILNKLRSAQKKAQEMRSLVAASQAHQLARTSSNTLSVRKTSRGGSLGGCFTCHAF